LFLAVEWRSSAVGRAEALKVSNNDEQIGVDIVKRAVEEPTRALAENAGVERFDRRAGNQETQRQRRLQRFDWGIRRPRQSRRGGPEKVTRTALQTQRRLPGLLLTTECLITEVPEKEKSAPAGHPAAAWAAAWIY